MKRLLSILALGGSLLAVVPTAHAGSINFAHLDDWQRMTTPDRASYLMGLAEGLAYVLGIWGSSLTNTGDQYRDPLTSCLLNRKTTGNDMAYGLDEYLADRSDEAEANFTAVASDYLLNGLCQIYSNGNSDNRNDGTNSRRNNPLGRKQI